MPPRSYLDEFVARFRHRWETDPQYRARMSGILAAVTALALCSCMGVASLVANAALATGGLGGSGGSGGQYGAGASSTIAAGAIIPTDTVPPWTPAAASPGITVVPNSQTPIPTPTFPPTATPLPTPTECVTCDTPTPTNGGGGGGSVTATWAPNPWIACPGGSTCDSVIVHTVHPNDGVNIIITYCNGATILSASSYPNATTDASGNWTFPFAGPGGNGHATVLIQTQNDGNTQISPPCH